MQLIAAQSVNWTRTPVTGIGRKNHRRSLYIPQLNRHKLGVPRKRCVPAGKDDGLWLVRARFGAWIDGVMSELRAGLQSAPDDHVRPGEAPGGEWVRYVSPRFGAG